MRLVVGVRESFTVPHEIHTADHRTVALENGKSRSYSGVDDSHDYSGSIDPSSLQSAYIRPHIVQIVGSRGGLRQRPDGRRSSHASNRRPLNRSALLRTNDPIARSANARRGRQNEVYGYRLFTYKGFQSRQGTDRDFRRQSIHVLELSRDAAAHGLNSGNNTGVWLRGFNQDSLEPARLCMDQARESLNQKKNGKN